MAGSHTIRLRGGSVRGRARRLITDVCGSRPGAEPVTAVTAGRNARREFRRVLDSNYRRRTTPEVMPAPMTASGSTYYPPYGVAPAAPRVEMGLFDTITESVFGHPDPDTWRPLLAPTFFSEGWNEAWVPSPNGSGGAPRQGWINAMDGNMYRLWFFTFGSGVQPGRQGQRLPRYLHALHAAESSPAS